MKIAVLISGGVDSSLVLQILHDQGHDVTAFYLKIWLEDEFTYLGDCPWEEDLQYIQTLCDRLAVPLEIISSQREYWDTVIAYTIDEVKAGRTPNPDIMCNSFVKFGTFYQKIDDSFEKVASGHYAQTEEKDGKFYLKQAPDPIKDQSYFLSRLTQKQLSRCVFPIGHLQKSEVRDLAQQHNLPSKDRKDSQGLCFLGKIKFQDFIKENLGELPGDIIEYETGKVLGKHNGFYFHTIGQRKGLQLSGGPWFVVAKDSKKNQVFVSNQYHTEDKQRNTANISSLSWIPEKPKDFNNIEVKLRHGPEQWPTINVNT